MRKPIVAGNWKMNRGGDDALTLAKEVADGVSRDDLGQVEVVLCPPYTALYPVAALLRQVGSGIAAGGQDLFWKDSGAYTSQVSGPMLTAAGARYVIVGHSETRGRFGVPEPDFTPEILRHFGESDRTVNLKARAALGHGLTPIVCVGETLDERERGETDRVVETQVRAALEEVPAEQVAGLVFAYEPVWAIGTGRVCDADEADRVCGVIRTAVRSLSGEDAAGAVRVQYGGSVKADNAAELFARPHIDGGLIGGASLKASDFLAIVHAARSGG